MSEQIISRLKVHQLTQGLSDEQLEKIAKCAELISLSTGELLFQPGDIIDSIYLVVAGRLSISIVHPGGREQPLYTVGPGNQFGVIAAIYGEKAPMKVTVDETAQLLKIGVKDAQRFGDEMPLLRRNVFRQVGVNFSERMLKQQEAGPTKIFGCILFDADSRGLLPKITHRLSQLGERVTVITDQPQRFGSEVETKSVLDDAGNPKTVEEIYSIVGQSHGATRVFIEIGPWASPDDSMKLIRHTEQVLGIAGAESIDSAIKILSRAIEIEPGWRQKLTFVWSLSPDMQIAPFEPKLNGLVARDFKVWLDESSRSMSFVQKHSTERLIHWIRGVQIGIALGGGAARGMAHLGVLRALESAGIVIDMLAGTSAGVLTGFTYCAGYTPGFAIANFTRDLTPSRFFQLIPKGKSWYLVSKFRTNAWDRMLRKYLFDWRLEQCPIPGFAISADLVRSEQFVRDSGDVVQGILESINLPVLAPPICRDGKALVDGGVLNVLPADVLVNHGCNFVIGVNVSSKVEHEFAGNRPNTPTSKMRTPNSITTMLRILSVMDHNMSAVGASAADFTIEPDVSHLEVTAFSQTPQIAEIGQSATEQELPRIKQILRKIDEPLFS